MITKQGKKNMYIDKHNLNTIRKKNQSIKSVQKKI